MFREEWRLRLQSELENALGSRNVYFQPPQSIQMEYPCIVYTYSGDTVFHADGAPYFTFDYYDVVLITKDPMPDTIMSNLLTIPYSKFDRHYVGDNLHHFSYSICMNGRISNV